MDSLSTRLWLTCATLLVLAGFGVDSRAQDIEPRAYSNAPVGVNFFIGGYAYTDGGLAFDPALPVKDPKLHTSNLVFGYARALNLFGKAGKVDVILPETWLNGYATMNGQRIDRSVEGISDAKVRLSMCLYGAPAVDLKEFSTYKQDLIVGVSLQVTAPTGQYDPNRLVNIGMNRWSFKPEIGISQALGKWTLEGQVAATFFTDNKDFYGHQERSQEPLFSAQGHVIYSFPKGKWGSFDATYFTGGQTSIGPKTNLDLQKNWRLGATFAVPLNRRSSIKLYASDGVSARTGNNYSMVGMAFQYRWGGGI